MMLGQQNIKLLILFFFSHFIKDEVNLGFAFRESYIRVIPYVTSTVVGIIMKRFTYHKKATNSCFFSCCGCYKLARTWRPLTQIDDFITKAEEQ
jgi:hypothetical protein